MDISMDIHGKSVDMDMDMDGKFHIHGKPGIGGQDPDVTGCDIEKSATESISCSSSCFPRFSAARLCVEHRIRPIRRPLLSSLKTGSWCLSTPPEVNSAERVGMDVTDIDTIQHDSANVFESLEDELVHLCHLRVSDFYSVHALRVGEDSRMQRQCWNALDNDASHPASPVEGVCVDGHRQTTVTEYHIEVFDPSKCISLHSANIVA